MIFGHPKTLPKRPQAAKPIFWALEYEYSGNQVPNFEECQKHGTCTPQNSLQIALYTSPNGLTRVQNKEKPNWVKFQKHCKNAVTIKMGLQLLQLKTILYGTF